MIILPYSLKDRVTMNAGTIEGKISNILLSLDGVEYKVRYWSDSEYKYVWVTEDEIEPCNEVPNRTVLEEKTDNAKKQNPESN